jgi:hypothetical protein
MIGQIQVGDSAMDRNCPSSCRERHLCERLALWFAGRGDWDRAHSIAQDVEGPEGAWVHAHLHRKEGDGSNAGYRYGRAGRPVCTHDLEDEWSDIASALLVE